MSTRPMRASNLYFRPGLGSTRPARPSAWRLGASVVMDTGMRGFLKWARQEYPPAIYQRIAAGIQRAIPQAFSGYMLGGWRKFSRFGDATTPSVDTADAANSTAIDPSWGNTISQIIGTATGAYLNIEQQQTQQAIVNQQLQNAANGKPPVAVSLSSSGITFGGAAVSVGTLLIGGGLLFLALRLLR